MLAEDTYRPKALQLKHDNLPLCIVVLLVVSVTTFAIDRFATIDLSTLLSVSGNAGGGLLILVLPLFLPARGRFSPSGRAILLALGSALILTALGLADIDYRAMASTSAVVVSAVATVIAMSVLGMTLWLAGATLKADGRLEAPQQFSPAEQGAVPGMGD